MVIIRKRDRYSVLNVKRTHYLHIPSNFVLNMHSFSFEVSQLCNKLTSKEFVFIYLTLTSQVESSLSYLTIS